MPVTKTILVFDDNAEVREIWAHLGRQDRLASLHLFSSWEDFLTKGDASLVEGAIAFTDCNFESVGSAFNGIMIAKRLRELGISRIYSISSSPEFARQWPGLFDAVLETKWPSDLAALLT